MDVQPRRMSSLPASKTDGPGPWYSWRQGESHRSEMSGQNGRHGADLGATVQGGGAATQGRLLLLQLQSLGRQCRQVLLRLRPRTARACQHFRIPRLDAAPLQLVMWVLTLRSASVACNLRRDTYHTVPVLYRSGHVLCCIICHVLLWPDVMIVVLHHDVRLTTDCAKYPKYVYKLAGWLARSY